MNNFTISQLAQFSGIKAPTIRMWEQRHNALRPLRTEGNTRYYDNQQLRRLLNIVSLQEKGKKISELSALSDQELFDLIKQESWSSHSTELPARKVFITQLVAAGMTYDSLYFEKILAHCLLRFGMKRTYIEVVYPMLIRTGLLWSADDLPPAQEHFISNLLRQKLCTAIDSLPPPDSGAPAWLLFLPENELHETGLLMADYLLRSRGQQTLYLGANVPLPSVAAAVEDWSADHLLLFLVHRDSAENIEKYLESLRDLFPELQLVLACSPELVQEVSLPPDLKLLDSVPALEQLVEEILTLNQKNV